MDRKLYNLHKNLLCSESRFFQGCLQHGFSEGKNNEVILEDDDVDAFELFIGWVYTHEVAPLHDINIIFGEAYILADRFCMEAFKNAITDSARESLTVKFVQPKDIIILHSRGYSDGRLTNYLIDQMAFDFVDREGQGLVDSSKNWESFEPFLKENELMKRFLDAVVLMQKLFIANGSVGVPNSASRTDCTYHDHKHTKPCNSD